MGFDAPQLLVVPRAGWWANAYYEPHSLQFYSFRAGSKLIHTSLSRDIVAHETAHALIDFGHALTTQGGSNEVFGPVIDDISAKLRGKPLDLFVMTHEHLDHIQGFLHAAEKLNKAIKVKQAWLTGSAAPGYYATHPQARKQKIAALMAYQLTRARLGAAAARSPLVDVLLANNDSASTKKCVDYLRDELTDDVRFVDRTTDLSGLQPSTTARISLWAPEEDTADYYGRFDALAAGLRIGDDEILEKLLPLSPPPTSRGRGAVSTHPDTYPGVPDEDTIDKLGERIDVRSTRDLTRGKLFLEFRFPSTGP